jgi:hypothetical protein
MQEGGTGRFSCTLQLRNLTNMRKSALVTYVTAGYPTKQETPDIMLGMEAGGAGTLQGDWREQGSHIDKYAQTSSSWACPSQTPSPTVLLFRQQTLYVAFATTLQDVPDSPRYSKP